MAKLRKLSPGDRAPGGICLNVDELPVELATYWRDNPILLTFLRHFG